MNLQSLLAAAIVFAGILILVAIPFGLFLYFKKSARAVFRTRTMKISIIIGLIFLFVLFYYFNHTFFDIDTCLDKGGAWDATQKICVRK